MAKKASKLTLIPATAKIVVVKKENPFTPGSAVHKRVQAVITSSGQSKAAIIKKGAKSSTIRWALNNNLVRIVADSKKVAA